MGYSLDEKAPFVRVLLLAVNGLVAGVVVFSLSLQFHILASLGIPLIVLVVLLALYNFVNVARRILAVDLGRTIVTLGIVLILLGVFISAGTKKSGNITDVELNSPVEKMGVKINVTEISVGASQDSVYYQQLDDVVPEFSFLHVDATIEYMGRTYNKTMQADYYPNYGLVLRPQIIGTTIGDLYMHLEYSENVSNSLVEALRNNIIIPETLNIALQTSPMIYLLWIGINVMVVGIATQLLVELKYTEVQD
jgi:hypothetical protein